MRCLEWMWDPEDTTYRVEYALLLRDGNELRAVHERHVEGLFERATWLQLLRDAGYEVSSFERPIGNGETGEVFLCSRPTG
jgi:hypothetical protein